MMNVIGFYLQDVGHTSERDGVGSRSSDRSAVENALTQNKIEPWERRKTATVIIGLVEGNILQETMGFPMEL